MKNRKGQGIFFSWLGILTAFLVITFIWIIFSNVVTDTLIPFGEENINNSEAQDVLDTLQKSWNLWPLIMVVGLVIAWVVRSQEPQLDFRR